MKEEYFQINEIWHYRLYDEHGTEVTNSLSLPGFSNKNDAENSAFGWILQNSCNI